MNFWSKVSKWFGGAEPGSFDPESSKRAEVPYSSSEASPDEEDYYEEEAEVRSATPPTSPEISTIFVVDVRDNQRVYCFYEPQWFLYNLSNQFVGEVMQKNGSKLEALGYYDKTRFRLEMEQFQSEHDFFEKYPEWKGRADCLLDRLLEVSAADRKTG